jgi:prepilin-type N-terminal cleavage/methylation domain-containing protein/prepilin-type processing-associated H-X9-DG protein
MRLTQRKGRAFTLIELLVVIAIIGILAAMLLPALNKARMRGYQAACVAREKQWGMVLLMYSDDWNGGLFETGGWFENEWSNGGVEATNPLVAYFGGTANYGLRLRTMKECPEVAAHLSAGQVAAGWYDYSTIENPLIPNGGGGYVPIPADSSGNYWPNIKSLPHPAQYLLLFDSTGHSVKSSSGALISAVSEAASVTFSDPTGITPLQRHLGGVNCLFGDGHVDYETADQIVTQDKLNPNPWYEMQ